jgi:hypothetical protein
MIRFGIRTILLMVAICAVCVFGFSYLLATIRPLSPTYYAQYLNVDSNTYSELKNLTALEFGQRIYAFDQNQFVDAIRNADTMPSVADENGHVPALKFDGDTFIILRKWINESGGLAISDDPDFASKLETFDDDFVVKHVHKNIFHWDLDLERDSYR